jgi:membrane-associated protein
VVWASAVLVAGYFLGQLSFVSNNIDLILLLIVVISIIPMVIEWARHRREGRTQSELYR